MKTRKETHKKKQANKNKLLVGTLFLSLGIGSSINVAFADQDIQGKLTSWFENQKTKSIETIEQAIMNEKEIQLQKVREEIALQMEEADEELAQFTNAEIERRETSIRNHATEIINNIDLNKGQKDKMTKELNAILSDALNKMSEVGKKYDNKFSSSTEVIEEGTTTN